MTEKKSLIGTNGTDPNTLTFAGSLPPERETVGEGGKDDCGNYSSAVKYTSDGVYSFNQASNSWFNFITFTSTCLLYTSPSPRDLSTSRMPSSA